MFGSFSTERMNHQIFASFTAALPWTERSPQKYCRLKAR